MPVENRDDAVKLRVEPAVMMLLLGALAFRLIFLVGVLGSDAPLKGDEINYQQHAADLAAGKGMIRSDGQSSAARPPLLPLVLGGLYRLVGVNVVAGRIFEVVLGVAIVGLTYMLARTLFSERIALVAGALAAVNPYLIFISSYLLTENLYTVLMLALLLVLEMAGRNGFAGFRGPVIAGFLLGLANLARPNAVVLAFVIALCVLLFGSGNLLRRTRGVAVFLLALAVVIAPWALRNHAKLGAWVVFTTHGGITFYQSNNQLVHDVPGFHGGVAPRESLPGWDKLKDAGEIEGDRAAWAMAKSFLKDNPRLVPRLLAYKFLRFWRLESHAPSSGVRGGWWWNKSKLLGSLASRLDVGIIYSIIVIPSFILGVVVTIREYRKLFALYGVILVHVLVAMMFYGSLRARVPIEPLIAVFAAAALVVFFGHVRGRAGRGIGVRSVPDRGRTSQ